MSDRYAVIGNPVAHSKSPQIHAEFARQTGLDMAYDRLLAPIDAFKTTAQHFFSAGGKGLNVTLPFKREAWDMVDDHAGDALDAQAVNTVSREGDRLVGHNTDGIGIVTDIERNREVSIAGTTVLLMGAGGATRGVIIPLLRRQPRRLVVANRTLDKARNLVRRIKGCAGSETCLEAVPYPGLAGSTFDIVINATSAGLSGEMPPLPEGLLAPGALAYDMVYGLETPFLAYARAHRAACADGLGMLVEQAAESFFIWRGVRPQTAPVIEKLRGAD